MSGLSCARAARSTHRTLLERGVLDLVNRGMADGLRGRAQLLIEDRHFAVMRRSHPHALGSLSFAAFARSAHLKITSIDEDTRFGLEGFAL